MIPFSKLLAVLNHPFDEAARNEAYAASAPVLDIPYRDRTKILVGVCRKLIKLVSRQLKDSGIFSP